MGFLPENYELPASGNSAAFLQMPKDGESIKFLILSPLTTGWYYWTADKKCYRFKEQPESTPNIKEGDKLRHFWAFVVYDVASKEVKIADIGQATIQSALYEIATGGDWELIGGCGIKISRTGKTMNDTKYTIMPIPMNAESNTVFKEVTTEEARQSWPNIEELLFAPPKEQTSLAEAQEVM